MKIYNYDKNTKEFLFSSIAQMNPKRTGEYLLPKNSTTISPPKISKNEKAVFNGKYWDVISDYRGLEQINTETKQVSVVTNIGKLEPQYMLYSDYILTDDYQQDLKIQEIELQKDEILTQIKSLDEKRIRAVCEPSVKNSETGETWLEYYNSLIIELRQKLAEVEYDVIR